MSPAQRVLALGALALAALHTAPLAAAPPTASAASSSATASAPTPAQIHQVTEQVLRQGKYHLKPSPVQEWLEQAVAALVRRLAGWLGRLGESSLLAVGAEVIFYTLTAAVGLVALVLLARFLLGRRRYRRLPGPAAPSRPGRAPSPGDLQAQASVLAARGQYGAALRLLQRACLLTLDRRGLLAVRPSSTDGEYLRQLRAHPALRALLAELGTVVEVHVYGGRALEEVQYRRGETAAQALLEGAVAE